MTVEHNSELLSRQDDCLWADIWEALWKEETLRLLDLDSLTVTVRGGAVTLTGHLSKEQNRQLIEDVVRSMPGVVALQNSLVIDHDLAIQVAGALAKENRTCAFNLRVTASHGWICLDGEVPNRELQSVAEEVAGRVPCVRGVIGLPQVAGERPCALRHPIQPQLGAAVYDLAGVAGSVTRVVIRPQNRLVTHVAVRANSEIVAGKLTPGAYYLVPAGAIELVNQDSVFLERKGPRLNALPFFNPDDYPLAPSAWKAPYPYKAGDVCWAFQPASEGENVTSPARRQIRDHRREQAITGPGLERF